MSLAEEEKHNTTSQWSLDNKVLKAFYIFNMVSYRDSESKWKMNKFGLTTGKTT